MLVDLMAKMLLKSRSGKGRLKVDESLTPGEA